MTPKRGTVARPIAHTWIRGPARREGEYIVLDGRRAERYEPMLLAPRLNVGIALSRVRTPADAVQFATTYGLLLGSATMFETDPIPADMRQPFADFERAAAEVRRILRTTLDVRAAARGDREALARVREDFTPPDPDADLPFQTKDGTVLVKARDFYTPDRLQRDDRTVLIRASDWVSMSLSSLLTGVHVCVFEPAQLFPDPATTPGQLRVGLLGRTLRDYCYLGIAQALSAEPLLVCAECHRVFIMDDKRQRYCDPTCANRARFQRFKTKQHDTASVTRARRAPRTPTQHKQRTTSHGKTTRSR